MYQNEVGSVYCVFYQEMQVKPAAQDLTLVFTHESNRFGGAKMYGKK